MATFPQVTPLAALEAARKKLAPLEATAQSMRVSLAALKADKVVLQKQLTATQSITATLTQHAWCADLTEDATGEVATIEIPGEQNLILIQAAAPAPTSGDGRLVARELQSPEQVYWNAAALPGWQKWHPTYRTGRISNISNEFDTADVALDAATSSAQSLNVNMLDTLHAIPIQYMTCNADAFEEGDHVVVRFDGVGGWSDPTIIGHVTDPRECVPWPLYVHVPIVHRLTSSANRPPGDALTYLGGNYQADCDVTTYSYSTNQYSAPATHTIEILEPVALGPGLSSGMTINGVTPGVIYSYGADWEASTFWGGQPVSAGDKRFVIPFNNGSGNIKIVTEAADFNIQSFLTFIRGYPLCDNHVYTDLRVYQSPPLVTDVIWPLSSLADFVSAHGTMPTVTISKGSRTKNYQYVSGNGDIAFSADPYAAYLLYQRVDT